VAKLSQPNIFGVIGFSDQDYSLFTTKVQTGVGIRLGEYKADQMRRRLMTIAKQIGCDSFLAYFSAMQKDSAILKAFLDHMTINVTELMRNQDLFEDLSKIVLPELVAQKKGMPLQVWSAGCSYGAEAYTIAMLLNEMDPIPPYRIKGTDLDLTVIARANQASFTAADMNGVSPERKKKFFMQLDEDTFMPMPKLRQNVMFSQHDLLSTDYPSDTYDLILCRNVVIYFTDEAKDRIYQNFYKALRPDGILFVGGTERLPDAGKLGFKPTRPFMYQAIKTAGISLPRAA
jgi:chemotaxis protein methyltransferase CheR